MSGLPTYSYRPTYFVAGAEKCSLQHFNEVRARGFFGGTFFRSIEVGKAGNSITIDAVEDNINDIFTVTVTLGPITETYIIARITDGVSFNVGGNIADLRSQMNVSALVTMPVRGSDINDSGVDSDVLSPFSSSLSGGNGAPENPLTYTPFLRTGYFYSMCYIVQSERTQSNGTLMEAFQTIEWDGNQWISFTP